MADNLIFPIKFDLEAAVREAQGDADRLLRRLQTTINAKPLAVNLRIDGAGSGSINEINSRLKELVKQWNSLTEAQRITNKTTGEYTAEAKKILAEYTRLRGASESYAQSLKQIDSAAKKAAKQQEKLAEAAYRGSNAFKNQDGYVSRLVKRLAVYASFQYTSQFLTNIREVTAQFELQRISLGAIIQDQQKANQLFAEIKSFALTSPLKILDLTKYTKQVAAYGFETEKLFDTTKMLADISVGLGVDFGRTVLAYSQVFTTGFLRASEARQMTEQGIPIVDKLAKKLTELNGCIYTAAEVMDMMSKRAISFELVEQVFKDMTSAGGEFYNMQVKQSQTLFGMWSKLGDAAAIMYDQIGNTSSINAGMKLAIRSIEQMMRNWKTTARVLDSVAVAMTVYIVGLKNAAIASKALTSAVALENLAHQQQIIRTPKIIAGIIGINNAKKISTLLTNLHTKAVLSEAAATNVLTKGFWKLTAAMLANPWVAAASAIALVGVALFHFIGNTETAAERAEKLNNSVASLKNLEDTTKPLIDTYNELINKTERTAEEQKKLSEVTHELAKQYPGAITVIGNFGEEVELAADKLNQLYQAEKQARMENTRNELEKTEQKITETEEKIARLQAQLQDGTKTVTVGGGITGYTQTVTVQMSDEDKGKVLKQIDELRYGEDGQSGLFGLQQFAEAARRALGLIPSEAAQAVEKFGAWKKTFTTFRQQVGDVRVQLFDDSTINQFGSLEEALKKTAEEYKKNLALVATYDETLKSATLTSEERAKIETERAEADAMANLAEKALKYYNAMSLLNTSTSGSGRQSDPRLQTLQEIANKMAEVNKEYDELLKKEGQTKALADTQKLFASSFKQMEAVAKKYKFKLPAFEVPQTIEDVQKWYKAIMDNIKRLKLKNADKVLIELGFKSDKAAIDKQQKDIEKQIKELADRISRTKTAKEFYEKILGMTGDVELAANVTFSIYGEDGKDLKQTLADQVRGMTNGLKLPDNIISADNIIDYKALRDWAKANEKELGEMYDKLVKISDDGQKELAKVAEQGAKLLLSYDEIAQKRVNIEQEASEKIKALRDAEALYLASNASAEQKEAYSKRTNKAVAGVEAKRDLDLLRLKDEYMRFFSAIHSLTKKEAETLRGQVRQALFKAFQDGAISADELKRELKAIDEQFRKLTQDSGKFMDYLEGGFDGLINRLRTMADEMMSVGSEIGKMDSVDQISEGQKSFIDTMLKQFGNDATGNSFASLLSNTNGDLAEMGSLLQGISGEMGAMAEGGASALALVDRIITDVARTIEGIAAIRDQLNEMRSEDNQLEGGLWDAFEYLENFNKYAAQGWENLKSGNVVGAVQNTIQSIISIFGTAQAQRVRRANKEIKRQQELLEQLEYTYGRLETAADKLFGRDYLNNYNQQIKNLQAQQQAYLKQAEAERSKGKKADKEKIKEYENQARETADKIKELQDDLVSKIVGTDVASAARDFANAWLDAYLSFGSTTDAIKEKFDDMIKNMIVNMVLAQVVKRALQPIFDMIDELAKDGELSASDIAKVFAMVPQSMQDINNGLSVGMEALKAAGVDISKLREGSGEYTGIAKSVAGATSEEINNVAAIGNTLMYYVSPIPRIDENLARAVAIMEGRGASALPQTTSAGWTDWQQQAMDNYNAIARNTADTVVECRRAAEACERIAGAFKVKGSTRGLNVFLNS